MANFIGMVYGTLQSKGIDTSKMSTEEAIKKFNELQSKDGDKRQNKEDIKKTENIKEIKKDIVKKDKVESVSQSKNIKISESFSKHLEPQHYQKVKDIISSSTDDVKNIWNKLGDKVEIGDANYNGRECYNPKDRKIYITQKGMEKTNVYRGEAYDTMFHEMGHNLDGIYSERYANYDFEKGMTKASYKLESQKYKGETLDSMLWNESNELYKKVENQLKEEAKKNGESTRIRKYTVWKKIENELRELPTYMNRSLSDIFEATSKGFCYAGAGHGNAYWKDHSVGEEAFAEMFSSTARKSEEVNYIKKYLPKSYEIFTEMLKEMSK